MYSELVRKWRAAAVELGLDVVSPFDLVLSAGKDLHVPLLVKNFGARNGMLIVTDYSVVKPHLKLISDLGFGFSVLEEPLRPAAGIYDLDTMIEMLSDWGWSGATEQCPAWIKVLD